MNEIFESVLERGLSELYSATSVTIQSQVTNNELFQNGSRPISIRPDILAEGDEKPLFVGDAKWKEDDPQSREPSTGDLYQILSYQVAYDVPGVLFYPAQAGKVTSVYDSQFDYDIYLVEIPTTAAERLSYADTVESTLIEELPSVAIPE